MTREKLEISRSKVADIVVLKDLYYNGTPIEELDKEQLLQALQEITATAMEWKERSDRWKVVAETRLKRLEEWKDFADEMLQSQRRRWF